MLLVPFVCKNLTKTFSINKKEVNLSENKISIGPFLDFWLLLPNF
jgi:hypothetical protein